MEIGLLFSRLIKILAHTCCQFIKKRMPPGAGGARLPCDTLAPSNRLRVGWFVCFNQKGLIPLGSKVPGQRRAVPRVSGPAAQTSFGRAVRRG